MKKRIITIIAVFLTGSAVFNSKAIVPVPADSLLQLELAEDFALLEKNRIQTGLLLDYGVDHVDLNRFNGVNVNDSSHVNMATLEHILYSIRNTAVGTKPYGPVSNIISQMSTTFHSGINPIGVVLYEYNKIKPTALAENLIAYSEQNGFQDVYINNVWQDPYESKTIAAFTPYLNVTRNQTVLYSFNPSYRFTNRNITSVQFDAGDGVGFRNITDGCSVSVTYTTIGRKELKLRIYYDGNKYVDCRSDMDVEATIIPPSSPSFVVDATQSFTASTSYMGYQPSATISIKYAPSNTGGQLKKPVIVAEGFDPFSYAKSTHGPSIQGKGVGNIESYYYYTSNYIGDNDIIYIDWGNSMAPIQANADILRQIIIWVNTHKANDASSNILIGESMGGLIARYALCAMEGAGTPHDVSVYVSHDSPHLGVNVPLGWLYAAQHLFENLENTNYWTHLIDVISIVGCLVSNEFNSTYEELLDLREAPSVRQMLKNYVNAQYQIDNTLYSSFQNELQQIGFPQGDTGKDILLLTFSNGGTRNFEYNPELAFLSISGTAEMGMKIIMNILLPGIVYGLDILNMGLWGLIPGASNFNLDVSIYPYTTNSGLVYEANCTYQKTNFLGSQTSTIFTHEHSAPQAGIPMDALNGAFYNLPISLESFSSTTPFLGEASFSCDVDDNFIFVPTASSLCYKLGTTLTLNDYNNDFWNSGVDLNQIPFNGYYLISQYSTYHTSAEGTVLTWAKSCANLAISGPSTAVEGSTYSVNNYSNVSWNTSNSQIATINNGVLHVVGFGTVDVIATVEMVNGKVQLRKTVIVPAPAFPGFPTYVLNKTDMTLPEIIQDYYPFYITAQPQGSMGSEFYSLFTYYWGEKIGSNPITWTTSSSMSYTTSVTTGQVKTVYFKAYYNGQYSTTYSTTIRRMDLVVPMGMDGDGNMHFDDGEEDDPIHVKGEVGDYVYTYQIDSHSFWFDHEASARELCQVMLGCEDLVAQIKTLRPWGEEELLAIDFTRTDLTTEEALSGVILIMYQDDMSE